MMRIEKIIENKKQFLDLLLLADEQENMIDKYLSSGDLFALFDGDLKSVCVVVAINSETCELKNIATYEKYQNKGYGRELINYISDFYKSRFISIPRMIEMYRNDFVNFAGAWSHYDNAVCQENGFFNIMGDQNSRCFVFFVNFK